MGNGDASGIAPEIVTAAPQFSDDYLALKFTEKHKDTLRYTAIFGRWSQWMGKVWQTDDTLKTYTLARAVCREHAAECNQAKERKAIASAKTVASVVNLARSDERHAATKDQWDANPWLLNTQDGIIDLKNCDLLSHDPEAYCTSIAAAGPGDNCDLWYSFLHRITGGDQDLIGFLQRMAGYCLTGVTTEHAIFFLYGTGANGKSVFLSTISGILADYHRVAPIEVFMASKNDRHPTELAMLRGARLVTATETEEGRHWNEAKLKALTGGDKITAHFMRQDFFEFTPQFKLVIAGNHRPSLRAVDEAIKRRMNLVPFSVTIPAEDRDPDLTEKLKAEWPGILAWMLAGCADWQRQGLAAPLAVRKATETYLSNEDSLTTWIEECCTRDPQAFEPQATLFKNWSSWCERGGEFIGKPRQFYERLESANCTRDRKNSARGFYGLDLKEYEPIPSYHDQA